MIDRPGLRKYMAKQLTLENYLFWKEAHDYREVTRDRADHIRQVFLDSTSANEINISSAMLKRTLELLDERDANGQPSFPVSVFNEAHDEINKLIYKNSYLEFLRSDICKDYITSKQSAALGPMVRPSTADRMAAASTAVVATTKMSARSSRASSRFSPKFMSSAKSTKSFES